MRILICLSLVLPLTAADWPAFRGPNSSGVSEESNLPVEMGPGTNVVWKTPLAAGHSSPIVIGPSIFLTGWEGDKLCTYRLDRKTGKVIWRRDIVRPREQELHKSNSPASPSPVSDGSNVFAFFTDFGLVGYDENGQERWRLPLGPFNNPFGMGASPLLVGDRIILNCDSETDSFLIAVQKETGKILWRVERPSVGRGFSTPILHTGTDGIRQALVAGSHRLTAYSVEDGSAIWWVGGLTWQMKPTPVIDGDRLFILGWAGGADQGSQVELPPWAEVLQSRDRNGDRKLQQDEVDNADLLRDWKEADLDKDGVIGERDWSMYQGRRMAVNSLMAVRIGTRGDATASNILWKYHKSLPNVPSPLAYRGLVYMIKDGGVFTALDGATGEVRKQGRITGALDPYYASPIAADGKIWVLSEDGHLAVIKAGADWDVITVNDLDDVCHATPAIADGRLYVRTRSALYAFANAAR